MENKELCTYFAFPGKASRETLKRQVALLRKTPLLRKLYESVAEIILILNKERQIVFFNQNFADFLNLKNPKILYGMRPGEALNCIHSAELAGGCGTTEFCQTCGAVNAILNSQKGVANIEECRIIQKVNNEALELQVHATPLKIGKEKFTVFAVTDISHEKRRQMLERIFFHDISNTVSCLRIASDLLRAKGTAEIGNIQNTIAHSVSELVDVIDCQKMVAAAESRELIVRPTALVSSQIIEELVSEYEKYAESKGVRIKAASGEGCSFSSDRSILLRVLGNMTKNAIEASSAGDVVTIGCNSKKGRICFRVHNNSVMPRKVQLQLYQRSFSTKGSGRGIGTYSMKLLSERYLKGSVSFASSKKEGTTFVACYPATLG